MLRYKYSYTLRGHEKDVRSVASTHSGSLVSASRDHSVRLWSSCDDKLTESGCSSLFGHEKFVNTCCAIPPCTRFPAGAVASGSQDRSVIIWDNNEPALTLIGHTEQVNSVSVAVNDGALVLLSCSNDRSIKVWDVSTGALLKTLNGHEHVVWSAVGTEAGNIASASADKRVGVWTASGQKAFSAGHTDSVRSCAPLAGGMFATGSNDCTVCIRDPQGHVIRTLVGHDNFVYCVASAARVASEIDASGAFSHKLVCDDATMIASCDENCTVRVWQQSCGFDSSAFNVPSTPWSCCFMPNGDIAVGCSDHTIRVFTADEARAASDEDRANFEAELSSRAVPMQKVDVSQFPPESSLSQPGSRDGQQKIVRNGSGGADAYSWSAADGAWQKIGEVTGSAGGAKTEFEGKMYDRVVDVAMGEGQPALKIAFNHGDDAAVVAQAFIRKHGLHQQFFQEIVEFIKKNQEPVSMASARSSFPCGATSPSAAPLPSAAVVPKLMAKISQFNAELAASPHLQLTPRELNGMEELLVSDSFSDACRDAIAKGMQWSHANAFPILDVLRCAAIKSPAANTILVRKAQIGGKWINFVNATANLAAASDASYVDNSRLMCLRCCNNLLCLPALHFEVAAEAESLLNAFKSSASSSVEGIRNEWAQLIRNISAILWQSRSSGVEAQVLACANFAIDIMRSAPPTAGLMVWNAVLALGTCAHISPAARAHTAAAGAKELLTHIIGTFASADPANTLATEALQLYT